MHRPQCPGTQCCLVHIECMFTKMHEPMTKAVMKAKRAGILPRCLVLMSASREKLGMGKMNDCPLSYTLVTQLGYAVWVLRVLHSQRVTWREQALEPDCRGGILVPTPPAV